jgi:hypothetical protein
MVVKCFLFVCFLSFFLSFFLYFFKVYALCTVNVWLTDWFHVWLIYFCLANLFVLYKCSCLHLLLTYTIVKTDCSEVGLLQWWMWFDWMPNKLACVDNSVAYDGVCYSFCQFISRISCVSLCVQKSMQRQFTDVCYTVTRDVIWHNAYVLTQQKLPFLMLLRF